MPDIRSTNAVFVSHCILAQCVMAEGVVKKFPGPVRPVLDFCLDNDINIFQMPCPETLCAAGGLGRAPRGKKWYEQNGLRATCRRIAEGQAHYMRQLTDNGINILGIIGVDFSPACAVNFLNRGRRVYRDEGIYMEELSKALSREHLDIRFIGINQHWHKKMERDLSALLEKREAAVASGSF